MNKTTRENLKTLAPFMSHAQMACVTDLMRGEEAAYFEEVAARLASTVRTMPTVYQQDELGDEAVAHLHYFYRGMDWWITEKDTSVEQLQAFGLAHWQGNEPECGYINLDDFKRRHVELDFHWQPKTLREIKEKLAARQCVPA